MTVLAMTKSSGVATDAHITVVGGPSQSHVKVTNLRRRYRHGNQRWLSADCRRRCCCCIYCWWTMLHLLSDNVHGYFLAMLTEGQVNVVNAGDSVVLDCTFHADSYNLFDYPVLWRKTQRDEETQINIMSNINEPFVNEGGRFEVVFTSLASSRYQLQLSILDVSQEDSGNYTCEVRGPQSALLGHVTHYVFVRAPVERIVLTDINVTAAIVSGTTPTSPRIIRVVENQPVPLRCVTFGGYPPPGLEVYVGGHDVTGDFRFNHVATMSGQLGLRTISYRTERWTDHFTVSAALDQQKIKCIATVPGARPYVEAIRLNVEYAPKITCYSSEVLNGEKNVHMRCDVRAKPRLTALFWIIDANGTALAEGEVINGHWTIVMDRDETLVEAQLFVRQAGPEAFRKYTIVAENNVAIATSDVELLQRFRQTTPLQNRDSAAANHMLGGRGSLRGSSARSIFNCSHHSATFHVWTLKIAAFIASLELSQRYFIEHFSHELG